MAIKLPKAIRETVLAEFKGNLLRWSRKDQLAMAYAITKVEDAEELNHPRMTTLRRKLRTLRRKLEIDLEKTA